MATLSGDGDGDLARRRRVMKTREKLVSTMLFVWHQLESAELPADLVLLIM